MSKHFLVHYVFPDLPVYGTVFFTFLHQFDAALAGDVPAEAVGLTFTGKHPATPAIRASSNYTMSASEMG